MKHGTGLVVYDTYTKNNKLLDSKYRQSVVGDFWCSRNPEIVMSVAIEESLTDLEKAKIVNVILKKRKII